MGDMWPVGGEEARLPRDDAEVARKLRDAATAVAAHAAAVPV
jgi:hypothetical protein